MILGREHEDLTTKVDKQNKVNVRTYVYTYALTYIIVTHTCVLVWGIPRQSGCFWFGTEKQLRQLSF